MALSFALIGVALSGILIFFNARRFLSSFYLGIFFLGVSLYVLNHYVLIYYPSVTTISIILLIIPVSGSVIYLTGPMLYGYVRSILTDNYRLKKTDLWHLLPMVIFFFAALPDLFVPWSEKIEAATAIANDTKAIGLYKPTLLSRFLSYPFLFLSRPLLVLFYTGWSIIIFVRYLLNRSKIKVFSGQLFMIKWLSVLLASLFILVISHTLLMIDFTLTGSHLFVSLIVLKALSLISLIVLLISPFFFPGILYGLPQIPQKIFSKTNKHRGQEVYREDTPKITPTLESEYLLSIQKIADTCMEELQPYLQSDCNLASLAKLTKIPAHHYSVFFRQLKKQSFNDYRNEWRIKHAKQLILEGRSSDLSLEGIGLLSGFSSRNTFYNAFKKVEGISPGAFAAHIGDYTKRTPL